MSKRIFQKFGKALSIYASLFILLQGCAARHRRVDRVQFGDDELNARPRVSKTLIVRSNIPSPFRLPCPQEEITSFPLCILLNLGEDYNYGTNEFTTSVRVRVTAYGERSDQIGDPWIEKLEITQGTPEKLVCNDFKDDYDEIYRFVIEIYDDPVEPDVPGYVRNDVVWRDIKLEAYFIENLKIDAKYTTSPSLPFVFIDPIRSTTNPQTFSWRAACPDIPNYQFQLLRLYNNDEATTTWENKITATVDWSKALTIETSNSQTSLTLTLAEGTGFYIWRVRPIGNLYEGRIANDANWGAWSQSLRDGETIHLDTARPLPNEAFFYRQFDDDKNWIYSRTFTEENKIAEQMTYVNGLLQVQQSQRYLQSDDKILVNQTVYDFSGRPALTTLAAPVTNNAFRYVNRFLQRDDGQLYTAEQFDSDERYKYPAPISLGALHDYYSDTNRDLSVPDAEGYPFTRALYYAEGTSRVKEISGVGATHRIKTEPREDPPIEQISRTVKIYYSGVWDDELIPMFGDEAPADTSVYKIITLDPNKTASVVYINTAGETIATCLANSPGNAELLDPLPSREGSLRPITGVISGNTDCGEGCLESSTSLSFAAPTEVILNYRITPQQVRELCLNTCQTCDYKIIFTIDRQDEDDLRFPLTESATLRLEECLSREFTWSYTTSLDPGSYTFSRRIIGETQPDAASNTYLQERKNALARDLQTQVDNSERLNQIFSYLTPADPDAEPDLNGLYNFLGVPPDVTSGETSIAVGCLSIDIPIQRCATFACPESERPETLFIDFFENYWEGESFVGRPDDSDLDYLPGYTKAEFTQLIYNMLNDPSDRYSCEELWRCWVALTLAYKNARESLSPEEPEGGFPSDYDPGFRFDSEFSSNYDLLDQFLTCTDRRIRGVTDQEWGPSFDSPGWRSHAYAYLNYTPGSDGAFGSRPECEEILSGRPGTPPDWSSSFTDEQWRDFSRCIAAERPTGERARRLNEETLTEENLERECENICEARFPGFMQRLERLYESLGYVLNEDRGYVKGDDEISWFEFYCQAQSLVEQCKDGCDLTTFPKGATPRTRTRVGTDEEIARYIQSLTNTFDVRRVEDCDPTKGYTIVSQEVNFGDILLSLFNYELDKFLSELSTTEGTFHFGHLIERLGRSSCRLACSVDRVSVSRNQNARFILTGELDNCWSLVLQTTVSEGDSSRTVESAPLCTICDCVISCQPLCFVWRELEITPDYTLIPPSCEQATARSLVYDIRGQITRGIAEKIAALDETYRAQCLAAANIRDRFTVTYSPGYYHHTLFYYDRAGNLVRTVPPKGVDLSSTSRSDHPNHTYVTKYEYNSLGELIRQITPDGGKVTFHYDRLGQLRFSQNAKQERDGTYSYSQYDYLGRIVETGQTSQSIANFQDFVNDQAFPNDFSLKREDITTVYSDYSEPSEISRRQEYLQNRVSFTRFSQRNDDGTVTDYASTYYSYDPHGNVKWLAQHVPGLGLKYVDYEYDLISRNVRQIKYNDGQPDQFYHRYAYDADNRLIQVETSRDGMIWDRDARYQYYAHGPLKRIILGEDKVQGIDYTYTLHGWLKGINHPSLDILKDPSHDSQINRVGKDAFGMALTYYDGDFKKNDSPFTSLITTPGSTHLSPDRGLFNGHITSWASQIAPRPSGDALQYEGLTGSIYRYDELGQLKAGSFYSHNAGTWSPTEDYRTRYTYDPNGNILTLLRNGYAARHLPMDDLTYHYTDTPLNNRLNHVTDAVDTHYADGERYYDTDLDTQTPDNYAYDEIGNLIRDAQDRIDWNVYGKVKQITKRNDDGTVDTIEFKYNSAGHRIEKIFRPSGGSEISTYYVRDVRGQILSIYTHETTEATAEPVQNEVPIYGSARVGLYRPAVSAPAAETNYFARLLGQKDYELQDHLGNVRAIVSDIKLSQLSAGVPANFTVDLRSYNNYYPFGSPMPDRNYLAEKYRFGFNGMEKDDEVKGNGSSYTTEHRFYDSRLGKWMSVDPVVNHSVSTYIGFANNPVSYTDPSGSAPSQLPSYSESTYRDPPASTYRPTFTYRAGPASIHRTPSTPTRRVRPASTQQGRMQGPSQPPVLSSRMTSQDFARLANSISQQLQEMYQTIPESERRPMTQEELVYLINGILNTRYGIIEIIDEEDAQESVAVVAVEEPQAGVTSPAEESRSEATPTVEAPRVEEESREGESLIPWTEWVMDVTIRTPGEEWPMMAKIPYFVVGSVTFLPPLIIGTFHVEETVHNPLIWPVGTLRHHQELQRSRRGR